MPKAKASQCIWYVEAMNNIFISISNQDISSVHYDYTYFLIDLIFARSHCQWYIRAILFSWVFISCTMILAWKNIVEVFIF